MNYLLDVNVLVAWGWADHVDHARVDAWLTAELRNNNNKIMTSAIPELGFVRVSVQRGGGQISPDQASQVLAGMLQTLGSKHEFLPDDAGSSTTWPSWCQGAGRTTDAHLLALARAHGVELATLDQGIPGAFIIPL
jgi:toxin-antitoxin system PIN domain toxin